MMAQNLTKAVLAVKQMQITGLNQLFIGTYRAHSPFFKVVNITGNPHDPVAGVATGICVNQMNRDKLCLISRTAGCCENICQPGCDDLYVYQHNSLILLWLSYQLVMTASFAF